MFSRHLPAILQAATHKIYTPHLARRCCLRWGCLMRPGKCPLDLRLMLSFMLHYTRLNRLEIGKPGVSNVLRLV